MSSTAKKSETGPKYYVTHRTVMSLGGEKGGTTGLVYLNQREFQADEPVAVKSADGSLSMQVGVLTPTRPAFDDRNILSVKFDGDLNPEEAQRLKIMGKNVPAGFRTFEKEAPRSTQVYPQEPVYDLVTIDSYRGTDQTGLVVTAVVMVLNNFELISDTRFLEKFRGVRQLVS